MPNQLDHAIGIVVPDRLYTLKAFKELLGVQDSTIRAARRLGLRVEYRHKQGFIYGQDWIDYVRSAKSNRDTEPSS